MDRQRASEQMATTATIVKQIEQDYKKCAQVGEHYKRKHNELVEVYYTLLKMHYLWSIKACPTSDIVPQLQKILQRNGQHLLTEQQIRDYRKEQDKIMADFRKLEAAIDSSDLYDALSPEQQRELDNLKSQRDEAIQRTQRTLQRSGAAGRRSSSDAQDRFEVIQAAFLGVPGGNASYSDDIYAEQPDPYSMMTPCLPQLEVDETKEEEEDQGELTEQANKLSGLLTETFPASRGGASGARHRRGGAIALDTVIASKYVQIVASHTTIFSEQVQEILWCHVKENKMPCPVIPTLYGLMQFDDAQLNGVTAADRPDDDALSEQQVPESSRHTSDYHTYFQADEAQLSTGANSDRLTTCLCGFFMIAAGVNNIPSREWYEGKPDTKVITVDSKNWLSPFTIQQSGVTVEQNVVDAVKLFLEVWQKGSKDIENRNSWILYLQRNCAETHAVVTDGFLWSEADLESRLEPFRQSLRSLMFNCGKTHISPFTRDTVGDFPINETIELFIKLLKVNVQLSACANSFFPQTLTPRASESADDDEEFLAQSSASVLDNAASSTVAESPSLRVATKTWIRTLQLPLLHQWLRECSPAQLEQYLKKQLYLDDQLLSSHLPWDYISRVLDILQSNGQTYLHSLLLSNLGIVEPAIIGGDDSKLQKQYAWVKEHRLSYDRSGAGASEDVHTIYDLVCGVVTPLQVARICVNGFLKTATAWNEICETIETIAHPVYKALLLLCCRMGGRKCEDSRTQESCAAVVMQACMLFHRCYEDEDRLYLIMQACIKHVCLEGSYDQALSYAQKMLGRTKEQYVQGGVMPLNVDISALTGDAAIEKIVEKYVYVDRGSRFVRGRVTDSSTESGQVEVTCTDGYHNFVRREALKEGKDVPEFSTVGKGHCVLIYDSPDDQDWSQRVRRGVYGFVVSDPIAASKCPVYRFDSKTISDVSLNSIISCNIRFRLILRAYETSMWNGMQGAAKLLIGIRRRQLHENIVVSGVDEETAIVYDYGKEDTPTQVTYMAFIKVEKGASADLDISITKVSNMNRVVLRWIGKSDWNLAPIPKKRSDGDMADICNMSICFPKTINTDGDGTGTFDEDVTPLDCGEHKSIVGLPLMELVPYEKSGSAGGYRVPQHRSRRRFIGVASRRRRHSRRTGRLRRLSRRRRRV